MGGIKMSHVCQRSGQCCEYLAEEDQWRRSYITDLEVEQLVEKRKEFPPHIRGCGMLVYVDGVATCLVEQEMGVEKKHATCKEYPEVERPCLRQINERKRERIRKKYRAVVDTCVNKIGLDLAKKKADRVVREYEGKGLFDIDLSPNEIEEARLL